MNQQVTAEQIVKSIQAQRNWKPQPRPWSTVEKKRDAQCRECGRIYLNTKRTLCPPCDSFTVEAIAE